ncbi:MAG: AMP-binding protein [Pseudomonadota bacterium]
MAQAAQTENARYSRTLFEALIDAAGEQGKKRPILEDAENPALTYGRLIIGALVLGKKLAKFSKPGETVGLLLPNTNAMAVSVFASNAFGRPAALMNFTAGVRNILSAANTAELKTIITSRRFIQMAELEAVRDALAASKTSDGQPRQIIYLEDVRKTVGTFDKLFGALDAARAKAIHRKHALGPDRPAVVLFTSGTEGAPKAVVLSNRNVVANSTQIFTHADGMLGADDVVLNPLPMFHSFGLTAGTIMPLLNGMRVILYPTPLHYKEIPKMVREREATVLFATDTFLQGYARSAGEGDLNSLRQVVAGAEQVKDRTRQLWAGTGANLLEGYGATECAPVLSCNIPPTNTSGTVGPLLPDIEIRIDPVPGIETGGRLSVRGPNVMMGYMLADRPGVLVPPADGWHDTGDIVELTDAGLVAIKGRAKRFAKIGGEMVSLAAVEGLIAQIWPDHNHVVIAVADDKKGEQLVLMSENPAADRQSLMTAAKTAGVPELWVPRRIVAVEAIPLLGSGKTDFPAAAEMLANVDRSAA